jgi:WD40 repeat protein
LPDGLLQKEFTTEPYVESLAFSPNGRFLASGGWGSRLEVWSLPDGALLHTRPGQYNHISSLFFSTDGRLLISGDEDGFMLWSVPDATLLKQVEGGATPYPLAMSADGGLLVSASYRSIRIWSFPECKQLPVCLMDPTHSTNSTSAVQYTLNGVTYTLPAGASLPPTAVCTCNTVQSTGGAGGGGGGGYWYPN